MKRKTLFGLITILVVSLLALMVYASGGIGEIIGLGTIQPIEVASPTEGDNISGNYNFTVIIEQVNSTGIYNVTFHFNASNATGGANPTGGNMRSLYNLTIFNDTFNQSRFNTTFNTALLPNGKYNLTVIAYNQSGGSNSTVAVEISIDNPSNIMMSVPSVDSPTAGDNISGSYNFTATFDYNSTNLKNVTFYFNASNASNRANPTGGNMLSLYNLTIFNNTFNQTRFNTTFNTALVPDGNYNLTVKAYNDSGSFNTTVLITLTVDNTKPNATKNVTNANYDINNHTMALNTTSTYYTNRTFNITAADSMTGVQNITLSFNNGSIGPAFNFSVNNSGGAASSNNANNNWYFSYNLSTLRAGEHTVTVIANDWAGNTNRSEVITFTINSPPNVSWNTIGGANYSLTTSNITFNFSVTNNTINGIGGGIGDVNGNNNLDMVMIMFNNGSGKDFNVTNISNGASSSNVIYWAASYNVSRLAEGSHTVTAFVNDTIANYNNTQSITFFVDYTKPVVTVTCDSGKSVGDVVSCTCTATDGSGSGIKQSAQFDSGAGLASESTTASSEGTFTSSTCSSIDFSGNVGTATGSYTIASVSSGGSGSSGSGGGSSSSVPGQSGKTVWASINAGESATVPVENGEIGVTKVTFSVSNTIYGAWVQVKKLDSLPLSVNEFSGKVYKNIDITHSPVLKAEALSTANVDFKVAKSWLGDNALGNNDVALYHYADDKWGQLATTVGQDDGTYVHYSAKTPGFSYFVIGKADVGAEPSLPADGSAPVVDETGVEAGSMAGEEAAGEAGGMTAVVVVLVVLAVVIVGWVVMRKRK